MSAKDLYSQLDRILDAIDSRRQGCDSGVWIRSGLMDALFCHIDAYKMGVR